MPSGQEIFDQMVIHQVELERVSAWALRDILKVLRSLADELADQASGLTGLTVERVIANIDAIIREIFQRLQAEFQQTLEGLVPVEEKAALWPWLLAGTPVLGIPLAFSALTDRLMIRGDTWQAWWIQLDASTRRDLKRAIRVEVREARRADTYIRTWLFPYIRARVEPLVRTTIAALGNEMRLAVYEANPTLAPLLEWTAIIDNRTSHICMGLDGRRWRTTDKQPVGHTRPWPGPPPAHWRCRSTLVPAVAGAPTNDERYDQWLKRQPPGVAKEVLGRTRYELWRAGKITTVRELTDQINRPLSVAQLQEKYGVAA